MKYNLPARILRELSFFAQEHSIVKIILFGSRARGTNEEIDELIMLIRDSFIPAFAVLKDNLIKKLDEAESDWM